MKTFVTIALPLLAALAEATAPNMILRRSMSLVKRDVDCGDGTYCPDGYYCDVGDNGEGGCCPTGEVCTGNGGVSTIFSTTTVTNEITSTYTVTLESTSTITETETSTSTSTSTEEETITSTSTCTETSTSEYTITTFETSYVTEPCDTETSTIIIGTGSSSYTNGTFTYQPTGNATHTYNPTVTGTVIPSPPPIETGAGARDGVKMGLLAAAVGLVGLIIA